MLCEVECRVLSDIYEMLANDFDPKDAIIYMEAKGLLDENTADELQKGGFSKPDRLRIFLRWYRRKAQSLQLLRSYFEHAGQDHIAEAIRRGVETLFEPKIEPEVPDCPEDIRLREEKLKRILLQAGAQRLGGYTKRKELMRKAAELLKANADQDAFFVILHGAAGMGKTSLALALLHEYPQITESWFDSIVWVNAACDKTVHMHKLFYDIFLLLSEATAKREFNLDQISTAQLIGMIRDAMIDRPNTLIILDDVVMDDTVRWADKIGLRVLATTRDSLLFSVASANCEVLSVDGFTEEEMKMYLQDRIKDIETVDKKKADVTLSKIRAITDGNPALLGIMCILAQNKFGRLTEQHQRLSKLGLHAISHKNPYQYDTIHEALSKSVERLSSGERDVLACAAIMPADQWISVEVWAMIIPVDMSDFDDVLYEVSQQLNLLEKRGRWVVANEEGNKYKMTPLISKYLKQTVEKEAMITVLRMMEDRVQRILHNGSDSEQKAKISQFMADNSGFFSLCAENF